VEADFHRYYHLDLVDLYRPGTALTWRKACALLARLPEDSKVREWERGGPHWSVEADIADTHRMNYVRGHGGKPRPHPLSPQAEIAAVEAEHRSAQMDAGEAREAARQARLAAQREEG
jgi:hypothetical protein